MQRRGREFVLRIGDVIAYSKGHKVCHFGRVTQVSVEEGMIGVHKYRPVNGSLRVKWVLAFLNEEGAVDEGGTRPVIERIKLKEVVTKADISRDGVLAASTSRKLDKAGYRLFEERVASLVQDQGADRWDQVGAFLAELFTAGGSISSPMCPALEQAALQLKGWLESHEARKVVFLEIYAGRKGLSAAAIRAGFPAAPTLDQTGLRYGRRWDLATKQEDRDLVNLLVQWLEPKVVHLGLPADLQARLGQGSVSDSDQEVLSHAVSILKEQERRGCFGSFEGPVGSAVFRSKELVEFCGSLSEPRHPWSGIRVDACQYGLKAEGAELWVSNADLELCSLRCRRPDALAPTVHQHQADRASHGGQHIGKEHRYKPRALCDAYWSCVKVALKRCPTASNEGSLVFASSSGPGQGVPDQVAEKEDSGPNAIRIPDPDVNVSSELTASEREMIEKEVVDLSARMIQVWDGRAKAEQWDEVKADLSVYRLSGEKVDKDPRREESYRKAVVEGLGFGENVLSKHPDFNPDDVAACREVLLRKAAGFWLEGSPRTTVRGVAHDCVPTGPPVSLQPHSLKGESAAWVDERLEEEVQRGQLIRGASPWGSPPFPTKEAPAHKKSRKRRLVVDYRTVIA